MATQVFTWLMVALTLSLLLLQSHHRRRVSAEIREGVAESRNILNATDAGIILTSNSGIIIKFNQVAEKLFAFKAENVLGKDFLLLLPKALREAHRDVMSGSALKTESYNHELVARRSDGSTFVLSLTVKPTRHNGQSVSLGMIRDISAIKRAEATSFKSQQMMEFLLNSSPIVFYSCDIEKGQNFTYVSPNIETLLGFSAETITDTPAFWRTHIHPDDWDRLQTDRPSHFNQERINLEYRLRLPDGNYRWINDSYIVVVGDNGRRNLMIGRWTDIHERKEMEKQLALKEERLSVSLKYTKLSTWGWLIEDGMMTWSGQIKQTLGVSAEELDDFDDFIEITHPQDRETVLTAFKHCLVTDEALDMECRVLWPDGDIHWIRLAGELINDESGNPLRMLGVLSDISDHKKPRMARSERRAANQAL